MAIFTNKKNLMDEALGEFKDFGFSVQEPDDHFTDLYFKDKRIARYYQEKVTIDIIRDDCRNYLKNINRSE